MQLHASSPSGPPLLGRPHTPPAQCLAWCTPLFLLVPPPATCQLSPHQRCLCPDLPARIGLSYNSSYWVWTDGTDLGTTITPSQTSPYAHWAQVAASTFASNPSGSTCVLATTTGAYTTYTGDGSPAQQTSGYYVSDASAARAWLPSSCTATAAYVCEGDAEVMYPCNVPPPSASPPPAGATCEWRMHMAHLDGCGPTNCPEVGWLFKRRAEAFSAMAEAELSCVQQHACIIGAVQDAGPGSRALLLVHD